MADRASGHERGLLETLALAGVGAAALAAEHVDELVEAIAARLHVDREEVRAVVHDLVAGRRSELEELELRVAQLEHRLRLLERSR